MRLAIALVMLAAIFSLNVFSGAGFACTSDTECTNPDPSCAGNTLLTYEPIGTCVGMTCQNEVSSSQNCPGGCSNGQCIGGTTTPLNNGDADIQFYANNQQSITVNKNDVVTLTWDAQGASKVTITGVAQIFDGPSGSWDVSADATRSYTLVAK